MILAAPTPWRGSLPCPASRTNETRLEREQKGLKGFTPQLTGKYAPTSSTGG